MAGRMVGQKDLAAILDVAQVTLTGWHRDHGMPIAVKGQRGAGYSYDIGAVFRWYGQWQVDKAIGKGHEPGSEVIVLKTEEGRLKKFQADKAEVDAQIARKTVLLIDDVKDTLNEIAATYGSQLDALGGRLANELAAIEEPAEIRQKLFAEGRRIREATADALEALVAEAGDIISEDSQSSSAANSG